MPAQKRPPPEPHDEPRSGADEGGDNSGGEDDGVGSGSPSPAPPSAQQQQRRRRRRGDEEGEEEQKQEVEGGREDDKEAVPYVLIKLSDIRKEVQCPICLGIIRKTRTVMECLHRFCRECIDKSMRLGNNECPACRTHCASRRSLRDDPNFDALIAVLYPDIDRYEQEELAFHEADQLRNKKIQASISETYQRQSEALGKKKSLVKATAAASFLRRQGPQPGSRSRSRSAGREPPLGGSDEDDQDGRGNDGARESSSADESSPDLRQKRRRRSGGRISPAPSPAPACADEVLVWGKNGARSQSRHGSSAGSAAKNSKPGRISRILDFLRHSDDNDDEFDVHLTLLPSGEQDLPSLPRPHLCCRPAVSVAHLRQFVALHAPVEAADLDILARRPEAGGSGGADLTKALRVVELQETLGGLRHGGDGDLVLVYRSKSS
ncbi:unnamed protein product [Spirodela intermedia]|uniref:RING-type domain-containing protein n=1 Tax=Spirodela intermedia TaxID=51605 RepID=A0A7I8L684_SPIIN|nr:unnamed protein product [Spirodela intermedia]